MPELPDLLYLRDFLNGAVAGRSITGVEVPKPVVLRNYLDLPPHEVLGGHRVLCVDVHGPFLMLSCTGHAVCVFNLMLSGRLQYMTPGDRPLGHRCLSLLLDDGSQLVCCDENQMAKVYIGHEEHRGLIPRFATQGVDVLSPDFTQELFFTLSQGSRRKQVRVFLNDHTVLSSIGNAYADEILFDARLHPKTLVASLDRADLDRLHASILSVLRNGINEVRIAGRPIQEKVRGHMKVRNRKGEPCPLCGNTIRREGVRGYDVFFCPSCQPPTRKIFLDWGKTGR